MFEPQLTIEELKANVIEKILQNPKEIEPVRQLEDQLTKCEFQVNTIDEYTRIIDFKKSYLSNLKASIEKFQLKKEEMAKSKAELMIEYDKEVQNCKELKNKKEIQFIKHKEKCAETSKKLNSVLEEVMQTQKRNKQMKLESLELDFQIERANENTNKALAELRTVGEEISFKTNQKNEFLKKQIALKERIQEERQRQINLERINSGYIETMRIMHNELLENKGNIRVFCRVRPYLKKENDLINETRNSNKEEHKELKMLFDTTYIEYVGHNKLIINGPKVKSAVGSGKMFQSKDVYNFDRVFDPNATQADIFEEISQLVQSALDGYKVCIFAYGQTGSGKTFTMEGIEGNLRGIIPRSIEKIFQSQDQLIKTGWTFQITLSFIEIYLDQIQDLLSKSKDNVIDSFKEAVSISVSSIEDITPLLTFALKRRTKAETQCNEKSSRSHSICQINILAKHTEMGQSREGALNLIDLAGSERIAQSKVEGDKKKEAVSINKSLSTLKGVINALASGNTKHTPYRESVLTRVLQSYLGGDSKTLMFVNISPMITQTSETNNSLKFATEVNSCQLK